MRPEDKSSGYPSAVQAQKSRSFATLRMTMDFRMRSYSWGLATTTAGDGGDDGEFVRGGDGGVFLGRKVADVVVIEVEVDEGAKLTFGGVEVRLHSRVGGDERGEPLGYSGAFDRDSFVFVGVSAQRGGDMDLHKLIIADVGANRKCR